jgi:hypothetical protein
MTSFNGFYSRYFLYCSVNVCTNLRILSEKQNAQIYVFRIYTENLMQTFAYIVENQ